MYFHETIYIPIERSTRIRTHSHSASRRVASTIIGAGYDNQRKTVNGE